MVACHQDHPALAAVFFEGTLIGLMKLIQLIAKELMKWKSITQKDIFIQN